MTRSRLHAGAAATVAVMLALPGAPGATRAPAAALPDPAPAARVAAAVAGCRSTVERSDPLSVAAAVTTRLYCGSGPPALLSDHAQRVVAALALPAGDTGDPVTWLRFLDPRTAPVTVLAESRLAGDPRPHRMVVTLFRLPDGTWLADDLLVVD